MITETTWHKGLVNYHQSSLERKLKYALCRYLGDDYYLAFRRRDWRWNKIARVHGYYNFGELAKVLESNQKEVVYSNISKRKLMAR